MPKGWHDPPIDDGRIRLMKLLQEQLELPSTKTLEWKRTSSTEEASQIFVATALIVYTQPLTDIREKNNGVALLCRWITAMSVPTRRRPNSLLVRSVVKNHQTQTP